MSIYRTNSPPLLPRSLGEAPPAPWYKRIWRWRGEKRVHDNCDRIGLMYIEMFCECLHCWMKRGMYPNLLHRKRTKRIYKANETISQKMERFDKEMEARFHQMDRDMEESMKRLDESMEELDRKISERFKV